MKSSKIGVVPIVMLVLGCSSSGGGGGNSGTGANAGFGGAGGATSAFSCTSSGTPAAMVGVPAGDFMMGCNPAVDNSCRDDEQPGRTVSMSAFQIDTTEVTQDEYAACVTAGACAPPSCDWNCELSKRPATCIDYGRAQAFCAWAGKHLPTEAEWEKAARGGDGRKYPWGNQEPTCDQVNMAGCGDSIEDVGSHPSGASPYGAMDMAGNMVELVADWYDPAYYASAPAADPPGPTNGKTVGGRGGGYKSESAWQRASSRDWYDLTDEGTSLGFRCAQ